MVEAVHGLDPQKSLHETFVDVEPVSNRSVNWMNRRDGLHNSAKTLSWVGKLLVSFEAVIRVVTQP